MWAHGTWVHGALHARVLLRLVAHSGRMAHGRMAHGMRSNTCTWWLIWEHGTWTHGALHAQQYMRMVAHMGTRHGQPHSTAEDLSP